MSVSIHWAENPHLLFWSWSTPQAMAQFYWRKHKKAHIYGFINTKQIFPNRMKNSPSGILIWNKSRFRWYSPQANKAEFNRREKQLVGPDLTDISFTSVSVGPRNLYKNQKYKFTWSLGEYRWLIIDGNCHSKDSSRHSQYKNFNAVFSKILRNEWLSCLLRRVSY